MWKENDARQGEVEQGIGERMGLLGVAVQRQSVHITRTPGKDMYVKQGRPTFMRDWGK